MIDVAGTVLSAFLQVLFDRIAPRDIVEFFKGNNLDEALLKKMMILLLSVNTVIGDAEEKQIVDPNVKAWVDEVRETVYDAEDISDEITMNVLQYRWSSKSEQIKGKISYYFSSVNLRLMKINEKLSFIVDLIHVLGLKEGKRGNLSSLSLPTTCLLKESEVFGRDCDKDKIINFLLAENENVERVSVVTLVGMTGIGKTTLSQLLFNDERVKKRFSMRLWVHVSGGSDVFEVTKRIYESVTRLNSEIRDLNTLQVKLKSKLNGKKRFLLVFDDFYIHNYIEWELLKKPLAEGAHGSVILVTTRSEKVSSIMCPRLTHLLQLLSPGDSWKLFTHYAFKDVNVDDNPTLSEIGKKIVEKCSGLPLATKALGSLLSSTNDAKEWDNMLKSKIWNGDKINILPALTLSYQHLSLHLKRCFAYCSLLPNKCDNSKQDLILLWIAEGLLPSSKNGKTMEEIEEEHLDELLSRSLLQRLTSDESSFLTHDLIRELAQYAGGEFFLKLEDGNPNEIPKKVRHLSFLQEKLDTPAKFKAIQGLSHLRSFLPFKSSRFQLSNSLSIGFFDVLLTNLVRLHVLSLSNYSINRVPDSIAYLKHLRYLNLSHTQIKKLPGYVVCLYNLLTLLLRNCAHLTKLPIQLSNLANLRHLDISGTRLIEMPPKFNRSKFLQLTSFFVSPNNRSSISELGALLQLRALSIVNLENLHAIDAPKANLKEMKSLEELELKWTSVVHNTSGDVENVLKRLHPHIYLRKLKIENYGGRSFPAWLGNSSFSNILSIHLTGCRDCLSLPQLGQLTSLKILHIASMTSLRRVDYTFYGTHSRPFRSLKTLSFEDMPAWEDWLPVEDEEFPSLEELCIRKCVKLAGNFSSHHLLALNKLVISECHNLVDFLPKVPLLQELEITDCNALVSFPDEMMQGNKCLIKMVLGNCPNLESFPSGGLPTVLKSLDIYLCGKLQLLLPRYTAHHYHSLELLHLESSCHSLVSFPLSSFPALKDLHIQDCPSLKYLSISADINQNLCCLKRLQVKDCSNLVSFPDVVLAPPNLQCLVIINCVNLIPPVEWGQRVRAQLGLFTIQ